MSDRAEALANEFSRLSHQFISTFEELHPEQLQAFCEGEQCTVAALGSHIAVVHQIAIDWIQSSASGKPLPEITMADVDRANIEQFARDANRSKKEILDDLRQGSAQASRLVRGLSDAELDRCSYFMVFDREVSTEDLINHVLIGDMREHPMSIENAIAATGTAMSG